eukprot:1110538-Pleurochrysis_carterae.AAC.2
MRSASLSYVELWPQRARTCVRTCACVRTRTPGGVGVVLVEPSVWRLERAILARHREAAHREAAVELL